jgi:protein phosphatase
MGTTMVMAYLDGDMLTVAHCGDSRCYVYSEDKELKYRTEDHVKNELIVKSFFAGYPEKTTPDVKTIKVSKGDRILLCSDGLYSSVYPDILRDRMFDDKPLDEIMDTYKFLCEKYSSDNYSGILVTIE